MFKKAYLEITDICNLNCAFCHGTSRPKGFISVDDFTVAATKLRPLTEYLYLHILGEPLLHPELDKLLGVCSSLGFKTAITTNGILLDKKADILLSSDCLYKVSVSLHSFEANEPNGPLEEYISSVCAFAKKAAGKNVLVSLRLWNENGLNEMNGKIISVLEKHFPPPFKENRRGLTLSKNIFLEYGEKFDWPDPKAEEKKVGFCMGLRDHIGVLFDGTVVPCCLDADGNIPLGNILTENIEKILKSQRASDIYDGFSRRTPSEELCKHCGYAERFG